MDFDAQPAELPGGCRGGTGTEGGQDPVGGVDQDDAGLCRVDAPVFAGQGAVGELRDAGSATSS